MAAHLIDAPFGTVPDLIRQHALAQPQRRALVDGADPGRFLDYGTLDADLDRVAAAVQRAGVGPGDCVAISAHASLDYSVVFLGALRAGAVVALVPPTVTPEAQLRMIRNSGARLVFADSNASAALPPLLDAGCLVVMDRLRAWCGEAPGRPAAHRLEPGSPFNIIYSSGTTGSPKGIVQSHGMRWAHIQRARPYGYGSASVTLLSTPLYSNTTLVAFFPTLANGGAVVLLPKFDVQAYLRLCEQQRATHTMLVPVQYQRIMDSPAFAATDLSSFVCKFATSAPFSAALKRKVVERWPGGLVEYYGMTEGGGTCILEAHRHPDKLHTVGVPGPGSQIRLIDEAGNDVPPGAAGEIVGRSPGMMTGYLGDPERTREVTWHDREGQRYIRTGDVGRFDADGFLELVGRKKEVIISGGFNVYPIDLEEVLQGHPAVQEAAVVAVPSARWGESPAAFVALRPGTAAAAADLLAWANERLGKTQRLVSLRIVPGLPRSDIGKVLKRELSLLPPDPAAEARV